jgi:hypothetical protein
MRSFAAETLLLKEVEIDAAKLVILLKNVTQLLVAREG